MDYKIILAVVSTIVGLASFLPYLKDIFQKKTQPHAYTWLIWVITQGTAVVAMWKGGSGIGALGLTTGTALVFVVFLFSLRHGTKNITKSDTAVLIAALLAIIVWWQLHNPLPAVLMVSAIDVLGYIPSFRKSFQEPWSETVSSWVGFTLANCLAMLALREYNWLTLTYLASITAANAAMVVLCLVRRSMLQSIKIPVENSFIVAKVYKPEASGKSFPAILFIHGWESAQNRFARTAELLTHQGYICVTFDMRGHGESEGDRNALSRTNFLNDVLAAYDYTANLENVNPDNIYVVGSSFGSYLGAILSTHRKIRGMVLRVPSNYPDQGFDEPKLKTSTEPGVMEWRSQKQDSSATESLRAVHSFPGKILIVESEKDEMVPRQTIQNYIDAVKDKTKLTHTVMENAPHSLTGHPDLIKEFNQTLINWLERYI